MEETYILKEGSLRTSMSDEHAIATIIEKYVDVTNVGVFVLGEQNSSIITFKINRFYDGVDLSEKKINVMYKNSNGIFKSEVYNVEYSETNLRFSWIVPSDATKTNKVVAYIAFISEEYLHKTKMFTLEVDKSFDVENYTQSTNWFVTIENELTKIDNKLSELDKKKAPINHSHTAEEIGAFFVPSKTSDLENDSHFFEVDGSIDFGRKEDSSVGDKSVAVGKNIIASGEASFATGDSTEATGNYANALGQGTHAWGQGSHSEGYATKAGNNSAEDSKDDNFSYSHVEGDSSHARGRASHAEGESTKSDGRASHAEGGGTKAVGNYSHAEGCNDDDGMGEATEAHGVGSHAEGRGSKANGSASHAEGKITNSSGEASHTEGKYTYADNEASHAEGKGTMATGVASHAEGLFTSTNIEAQHVQGKYNVEDTENKYAHIVGGGTSDSDRKNIHTIDWDGNAEFAGDIIFKGEDEEQIKGSDLVKKEYVDNNFVNKNPTEDLNMGKHDIIISQKHVIYGGTYYTDNINLSQAMTVQYKKEISLDDTTVRGIYHFRFNNVISSLSTDFLKTYINEDADCYLIVYREDLDHAYQILYGSAIKQDKPLIYTRIGRYLEKGTYEWSNWQLVNEEIPDWAKKPTKPSYTAEEVGALPEDTEIPDITALEDRVSKLERGGASGGTYIEPEWEKVAEIPMNTETVIYELASTNDYHDILVAIKRVKMVTGSGNTFLRLISDKNTNVVQNTNSLGDPFGYTNTIARLSINGDIVETIQKSSNNMFTGTTIYSIYDNVTRFKNDSKFALVTSEMWAQATSDGDTITVYGKRRQS